MPALDACDCDGCLNHNIPSPDVPTGNDDPCNTSGNGVFCIGSFWLYDPTEPGADTATNGDCPRLFLRTGGDCTVDQWLELHIASVIRDTVDPVDGVDCCPPGTIWCNTTSNATWMSTNGCTADNDCTWCEICGGGNFSAVDSVFLPTQGVALPLPADDTNVIDLVTPVQVISNPTNDKTLHCSWNIDGFQLNALNQDVVTGIIGFALDYSTDGGATWITTTGNDTNVELSPDEFAEFSTVGYHLALEILPGDPDLNLTIRRRVWHDGGTIINTGIVFADLSVSTVLCVAVA